MQCRRMQSNTWVATTHNSVGAAELKQKTIMAMNAFCDHSKGQVDFLPCSEPLQGACICQQNMNDCGMSMVSLPLTKALNLDRSCMPAECPAYFRTKWCNAISQVLKAGLPVPLDENLLDYLSPKFRVTQQLQMTDLVRDLSILPTSSTTTVMKQS